MAYTPINNAELAPDRGVTTSLMTRLRDNPEAIAAGDVGAPKVIVEDALLSTGGNDGDILTVGPSGEIVPAGGTTFDKAYIRRRGGTSGDGNVTINFNSGINNNGFSYSAGEFTYTGSGDRNFLIIFNANVEWDATGTIVTKLQYDGGGGYADLAVCRASSTDTGTHTPIGLNAFWTTTSPNDKFRVRFEVESGSVTMDLQNGEISIVEI